MKKDKERKRVCVCQRNRGMVNGCLRRREREKVKVRYEKEREREKVTKKQVLDQDPAMNKDIKRERQGERKKQNKQIYPTSAFICYRTKGWFTETSREREREGKKTKREKERERERKEKERHR